LESPHVGDRTEKDLISAFVNKIDELRPQLVTFNGSGFDLPVVRYRAVVNEVSAPGLSARPYFNRYTEDARDLCDVLASFNAQCRASLDEICRLMGIPGKPDGFCGSDVESYFRDGKIQEISAYCERDVVNTYRVWLRHALFRGRLDRSKHEESELRLSDFLDSRKGSTCINDKAISSHKPIAASTAMCEPSSTVGCIETTGEVPLSGDATNYVDKELDCTLSFNFMPASLVLNQDGSCGLGLNVSAAGTYKRVSGAPSATRDICRS